MTELEFEKAVKCPLFPVANEFAWGNTTVVQATGISDAGLNNETASNSAANTVYNNHASVQGPMRIGSMGQGINTRTGVGASYYGILDLSGNLWERPITVGNEIGRSFRGIHENELLSALGRADVSFCPDAGAEGVGNCGSERYAGSIFLQISDRYFSIYFYSGRYFTYGGRVVRLAT